MITLYSYPQMFGLPDNNPFGLKVDTFLRLAKIPYQLIHIINTKDAPRRQLPFIVDNEQIVTDSNYIISYLCQKNNILIDSDLTEEQKNIQFLLTRMLDNHLYWVMSYSRWQDERYWPLFKTEFLKNTEITEDQLEVARKYNIEKYHFQGIGRCSVDDIYQSGLDSLASIAFILGEKEFIFGDKVHSLDASCYGFLANIFYFNIDTPLKKYVAENGLLKNYIGRVRLLLGY